MEPYSLTIRVSGRQAHLLCDNCLHKVEDTTVGLNDNHTLSLDRMLASWEEQNGKPEEILCRRCLEKEQNRK